MQGKIAELFSEERVKHENIALFFPMPPEATATLLYPVAFAPAARGYTRHIRYGLYDVSARRNLVA
jgi:hypothetical protein